MVGSSNHVVAAWSDRGIWIENWTYGLMPAGENGCMSPDLIYVSQIRLNDRRWTTSLGLHVGDPTTKLRKLYPRALYVDAKQGWGRPQYLLVWRHHRCVIGCGATEQKFGVDEARVTLRQRCGYRWRSPESGRR